MTDACFDPTPEEQECLADWASSPHGLRLGPPFVHPHIQPLLDKGCLRSENGKVFLTHWGRYQAGLPVVKVLNG